MSALVIRITMFHHMSGDMNRFLLRWVDFIRENGYMSSFADRFSDYAPLYLYLLTAIAYFDLDTVIWIKIISVVFDVVLAIAVYKLVSLRQDLKPIAKNIAYVITLFVPTILMNSSIWGQCDSLYTAFALFSIYFLLKGEKHHLTAMIFLGFAFAFKLQTIYLLPLFLVYILEGKLKWYKCLIVPAVYVLTIIPAVLSGASFMGELLVYVGQASEASQVRGLYVNFPSLYTWVSNGVVSPTFGLAGALTVIFAACSLAVRAKLIDKGDALKFVYLMAVLMPFVTPGVHDRHLFPADALAVIYLLVNPKRWYVPISLWMISYIPCAAYLFDIVKIDFGLLTIFYFFIVLLLIKDVFGDYFRERFY
ncbi:MAG: hypothetical protein LBC96_09860 [Lachnospiraceae bacterium]|nr:hypothetical protein [Lachnospiraceae bacterium]